MYRDAHFGGQNMPTNKRSVTRQTLNVAFNHDHIIGEFTGHKTGVTEDGANTPLNIGPSISARGAGLEGELIKVLLHFHQVLGCCLERQCSLMKRHGPQGSTAYVAGIAHNLCHINSRAGDLADRFAAYSIYNHLALSFAFYPGTRNVTFELHELSFERIVYAYVDMIHKLAEIQNNCNTK